MPSIEECWDMLLYRNHPPPPPPPLRFILRWSSLHSPATLCCTSLKSSIRMVCGGNVYRSWDGLIGAPSLKNRYSQLEFAPKKGQSQGFSPRASSLLLPGLVPMVAFWGAPRGGGGGGGGGCAAILTKKFKCTTGCQSLPDLCLTSSHQQD